MHHAKGLAFQGEAEWLSAHPGPDQEVIQEIRDNAVQQFQKAISLNEDLVSSLFHLGLMQQKSRNFQEALKAFSKVLSKTPNDKVVYIARGVAHQDMGNHAQAIKDFNQSLEIDPELSDGYFRRGFSKLYSKLFQDAIVDFQWALSLEKKGNKKKEQEGKLEEITHNFGILDGLGCCFHALGLLDRALQYYGGAIDGDATNTEFLMHRAQCYFDQQRYEESIEDLDTGLGVREGDP